MNGEDVQGSRGINWFNVRLIVSLSYLRSVEIRYNSCKFVHHKDD